jgi:hypothetical protein
MGWLITLGILALLAGMPLGVSVCYDSAGVLVKVIAGFLRIQVVPSKSKSGEKDQKEKHTKSSATEKKTVKQTKAPPKETAEESPVKKGGSAMDFMPLVQLALEFLGSFTRKLRVNRMELRIVLAGDDPCDLAVNYGKAWTALGNLWPRLEEVFVIRKRDVEVQCDFEGTQTLVTARVDISITLGRLLSLLVCYGVRALRQYMKITDKRKGGAAI